MSFGKCEQEFEVFQSAISRLHHSNGYVVGAGFLVSECYLLTCAHVVTAALGIDKNTQHMPSGFINLDFPQVAPGQMLKSKVMFWRPVNPSQTGEDIAGLLLLDPLPPKIKPLQLIETQDFWEHEVRILGFPRNHVAGIWATGVVRSKRMYGWVQIDANPFRHREVQKGFSGAPVWDATLNGVVGMTVAAEKVREGSNSASFMIPTSILRAAWPELKPKKPVELLKSLIGTLRSEEEPQHKFQKSFSIIKEFGKQSSDHTSKLEKDTFDQPKANYTKLCEHLSEGEWQQADLETIQLLLQIAGNAEASLLAKIDSNCRSDIYIIDQLWQIASEGKFGFGAQKDVWMKINGKSNGFNAETFRNFGKTAQWHINNKWIRHYEDLKFSLDAPKGHLPSLRFPCAEKSMNWCLIWRDSFEQILSYYLKNIDL